MSFHGRRRQRPGPGPRPAPEPAAPPSVGPAQLGWALLVIAAALIGGLAAATLVHTSITIAVIVSVVAGGIAILATFWSPPRAPELRAGESAEEDFGQYPGPAPRNPRRARRRQRPSHPRPSAPSLPLLSLLRPPTRPLRSHPPRSRARTRRAGPRRSARREPDRGPVAAAPAGAGPAEPPDAPWWDSAQGGPPPPECGRQAGARSGPVHLPGVHIYRAVPTLRRIPARHPAGSERLGFPL